MGLLDYLDEDWWESEDSEDTSSLSEAASEIDWDWGESSEEESESVFGDLDGVLGDLDFSEFGGSLSDIFGSEDDEEGGGLSELLGNVPSGVWSRLLSFGTSALGEWMRQRNATPDTKSKGGGGGGKDATSSVTRSVPVGTRTSG